MENAQSINERLSRVEARLDELQRRFDKLQPHDNWLEKIKGSMKDCPEFDEVIALGRAFRASEYPPEDFGQ